MSWQDPQADGGVEPEHGSAVADEGISVLADDQVVVALGG